MYILHIQSSTNNWNSGNNVGLIEPKSHCNTDPDQILDHQNNSQISLTFVDYNTLIIDCNVNIDVLAAKTNFTIVIGCDFDPFDSTAMRIDIYNRMRYITDQIQSWVDVHGTINSMPFVIDTFVEILLLTSFINAFSATFTAITLHSDKRSKFEYNYVNYNNITIINTILAIRGAAIVIGFFFDVIRFVTQVIDESSINISFSNELYAVIVEITQLEVYLGARSSISTVYCNTQFMHDVCAVFCYLFLIFLIFSACAC